MAVIGRKFTALVVMMVIFSLLDICTVVHAIMSTLQ